MVKVLTAIFVDDFCMFVVCPVADPVPTSEQWGGPPSLKSSLELGPDLRLHRGPRRSGEGGLACLPVPLVGGLRFRLRAQ